MEQTISQATINRAQDIINKFRELPANDIRSLDFITSSYLAGDGNKTLRQAVIFCITSEKKPLSKCSLFAVSDSLKKAITQTALF